MKKKKSKHYKENCGNSDFNTEIKKIKIKSRANYFNILTVLKSQKQFKENIKGKK